MSYLKGGHGMNPSIPGFPPARPTAGNSRLEAVVVADQDKDQQDQDKLKNLTERERRLVQAVMAKAPGLTVDEALAMLKEAGM